MTLIQNNNIYNHFILVNLVLFGVRDKKLVSTKQNNNNNLKYLFFRRDSTDTCL